KVIWENDKEDFVSDQTELDDNEIKSVQGIIAVHDVAEKVIPLQGFPDPRVAEVSRNMIESHSNKSGKILKQRQKVKVVPIAIVSYKYRKWYRGTIEGTFYVFG